MLKSAAKAMLTAKNFGAHHKAVVHQAPLNFHAETPVDGGLTHGRRLPRDARLDDVFRPL